MGYHEVTFNHEVPASAHWLHKIQPALFNAWRDRTGHFDGAGGRSLACKIVRASGCQQHLSLPCSLANEANEIGSFLQSECFNSQPVTFFRLLLILLDEFCERLHTAGNHVLQIDVGRPPKLLSIWANNWAKHRLQILLQHHPCIIFRDRYGCDLDGIKRMLADDPFQDNCGTTFQCHLIETSNLGELRRQDAIIERAALPCFTVIVVPTLDEFLFPAIDYFERFVSQCLSNMERLKLLESEHFSYGCFGAKARPHSSRPKSSPSSSASVPAGLPPH